MSNIQEELVRVIGEPWNFLMRQNEGYVARHTIIVVALTFEDPTMNDSNYFTWKERNMLKWAALLHDISKRSVPTIQGKDHIHPFTSAVTTIDILRKLKLIPKL